MHIENILEEREKTHGSFPRVANRAMMIESIVLGNVDKDKLSCAQWFAITNIACKLARIVEGDPSFKDHWVDIQGYAALAVRHSADGGSDE